MSESRIDITQFPDTVEAFGGNEHRAKVFLDRYARKDENGDPIEREPKQMWHRVAVALADDDEEAADYYSVLDDFRFVPGGRILAGAGTDTEVTFYNCYVIPVETEIARDVRQAIVETGEPAENFEQDPYGADSRRAIFDTIGRMVDIMSRGGGVGINWSVLRPEGAYLKTVNGTASGPVGWMDVASKAVGEVEQGGSRRGAAMFMLDDWHPDVERFIEEKRDLSKIENANISVCVSDLFMFHVVNDLEWTLGFPETDHPAYNAEWDGDLYGWKEKGYPTRAYRTVKARDLWRKMAEMAWDNGEPGVVFLDRYNKMSTGWGVEKIISVNPCGEQGLGAYSVCNLGSINFDAYVKFNMNRMRHADGTEDPRYVFDWNAYRGDVKQAIEMLDKAIDKNFYFIPENEKAQKDLRRIGLGGMGLADALIGLEIRYGSGAAIQFTEDLYREMKISAVEASVELARAKGPAPAWKPEMVNRPFFRDLPESLRDQIREHGMRNLFLLTQAPTGTTSLLAGVNSGIEPYFAFGYLRNDRTGKHWVASPAVRKYQPANQPWDVFGYPEYAVTANEVSVEEHILMQAAVQRNIDSSVSKTINAPNSHTVEDVEKAYTMAYEMGLKGVAYFRDGCGRAQVLYREDPEDRVKVLEEALQQAEEARVAALAESKPKPKRRAPALSGRTWKQNTVVGHVYVTVNRDGEGNPQEVFINAGKAGSDVVVMGEALGRVISLALQNGTDIRKIAHTLNGVGGRSKLMPSLPNAVSVSLLEDEMTADEEAGGGYVEPAPEVELSAPAIMSHESTGQLCPECQSFSVVLEEGCSKCHVCGYSAC